MTTASAKKMGLTEARKWLVAREVPMLGDAVRMMVPEHTEESPSWQDIVDFDNLFIQDGVLHMEASMQLPRRLEHINVNAVMMPG